MQEHYKSPRELVQVSRCMMLAKSSGGDPYEVALRLYGNTGRNARIPELLCKDAVESAGTAGFGSELYSPSQVSVEFAAAVRPLTVLGRLSTVGVPLASSIGFIAARTSFDFVEERAPIPCTSAVFDTRILPPTKISGIAVVTKELLKSSRGEEVLQREMVAGVVEAMDFRFLDPLSDATAGRPASVSYGVDPTYDASGVDTPDEIDGLLHAMVYKLIAEGSTLQRAAFVMSPQNATALALLRNTDGSLAYPTVTVSGGSIGGLPLLTSASAPADGLTLVDGDAVLVGDDGETSVIVTDSAFIDMGDAPDGSNRVSVFQADAVALKVVRTIHWRLRYPFVAYATNFTMVPGMQSTV